MYQNYPPYPPYPYYDQGELMRKKELRGRCNRVALASLAVVLGTQVVAAVVQGILLATGMIDIGKVLQPFYGMGEMAFYFQYSLIYILGILLPFVLIACVGNPVANASQFPLSRPEKGSLAPLVALGLGVCMLANMVTNFIVNLFEAVNLPLQMPTMDTPATLGGQILYVIVMAVLPAFVEEFAFRGVVLQSLLPYGTKMAVVVSSLLFALFHGNFVQMPFAFIVGLVLAYVVVRSGSMWTGVVLHFCNNFFATALELIFRDAGDAYVSLANLIYMCVILIAGIVGFLVFRQKFGLSISRTEEKPVRGAMSCAMSSAGVIVAIVGYFLYAVAINVGLLG